MNIEQENEFHKKALEEWNRKAEERLDTINALQAKLTKIGGLLDYWGNSGKQDYCGKLFRAIEAELEK
jgi:predicted ATP-dependent protease